MYITLVTWLCASLVECSRTRYLSTYLISFFLPLPSVPLYIRRKAEGKYQSRLLLKLKPGKAETWHSLRPEAAIRRPHSPSSLRLPTSRLGSNLGKSVLTEAQC
ncbi:hypothetical protein F5Y17DRAFT_17060 [Xylariaceae sp. FL0594]|nr:hypothetical protein F5Y17DRAFT_17060 [Xylariaceae sp. FL0594]